MSRGHFRQSRQYVVWVYGPNWTDKMWTYVCCTLHIQLLKVAFNIYLIFVLLPCFLSDFIHSFIKYNFPIIISATMELNLVILNFIFPQGRDLIKRLFSTNNTFRTQFGKKMVMELNLELPAIKLNFFQ